MSVRDALMGLTVASLNALTLLGCGGIMDDPTDEAQWSSTEQALHAWACEALDPSSGKTYVKTGSSEESARNSARKDCESKTEFTCVVPNCYETTPHAEGTDWFGRWGCIAEDPETYKPYSKFGEDIQDAREKTLAYCHKKTARDCLIRRCFPAN